MRRFALLGCCSVVALAACGCARPTGSPSQAAADPSSRTTNAAALVPESDQLPADDPAWRGLERREIQLDQKLLVVKGSKGVIGCPYLNIDSFEGSGEVCAIIPAVDTAGMLDSKVTAATTKAKALGIEVGMSGRESLDKIR
ncbi:MAG: DUF1805 domain-containing protein [Pirellulales bacterium]